MIAAAFLPPTLRVLGFFSGIVCMVVMHWRMVLNLNLGIQLALYLTGAVAFLRCEFSPVCIVWCLVAQCCSTQ